MAACQTARAPELSDACAEQSLWYSLAFGRSLCQGCGRFNPYMPAGCQMHLVGA